MGLSRRIISRLTEALPGGRSWRFTLGMASGVLTKGIAFSLTLITVPMTLNYLGPERYGIWVTMISILAWFGIVDLGIANGLTPALSAAFGKKRNDLAQEYVATAFWSLTAISGIAGLVIALFWDSLNWGWIFNVDNAELKQQVSHTVALAVTIFLVMLPFSIIQRIFLSYQEGLTANLWQLGISLGGVAGIYIVTWTEGGLVYLVLGYLGAQFLVMLTSAVWLFGCSKPYLKLFILPNLAEAKNVLSLGGVFFVLQVATLLIYQKDIILITHYLGSSQAAAYSVAWQIFLYLNVTNMLIAPYLGPIFGEAYANGDLQWMRRSFLRYILITVVIAFLFVVLGAWFYKPIITAWVGASVMPTSKTVFWLALWALMLGIQSPVIILLSNTGRLRVFTIAYTMAACTNIPLSVVLIKSIGVTGGVIASVVTMSFFVLLPSLREVLILLKISKYARLAA